MYIHLVELYYIEIHIGMITYVALKNQLKVNAYIIETERGLGGLSGQAWIEIG